MTSSNVSCPPSSALQPCLSPSLALLLTVICAQRTWYPAKRCWLLWQPFTVITACRSATTTPSTVLLERAALHMHLTLLIFSEHTRDATGLC